MQLAHSTSDPPALPFDSVAPLLEVDVVAVREREVVAVPGCAALDVIVEVVVLLTFATGGLEPPPPHPATRIALINAVAAGRIARGARIFRRGSMPRCVKLVLGVSRGLRAGSLPLMHGLGRSDMRPVSFV